MNAAAPPCVHALLLRLLSVRQPVSAPELDALTPADWATMLALCQQHRLGPLLHWQLTHHHHLQAPEPVGALLAEAFKRAALRSLTLQATLRRVHQALQAEGIPHVALKGAGLAWSVYPHAALRPMRDLDLLIPAEHILRAYDTLLRHHCSQVPGHEGSLEATLALGKKHLPPLQMGGVLLELHARLTDGRATPHATDLGQRAEFWAHCQPLQLGGDHILTESPTDLLWHLIDHSVSEHQFNNGPLLLSDVAFLLARSPIDWPRFWAMAQQEGKARGCALALQLVERHWGPQPITWPHPHPHADTDAELEPQLARCDALMLTDLARFHDHQLASRWQEARQQGGRLSWLASRLFPPRAVIASKFPVQAQSPWVWFWYPVRWWQQFTHRMPGLWRGRAASAAHTPADDLAALRRWLAG